MLTVNFDPFPLLTTERLILRRMVLADANELHLLRSDERVMKYIDRPKSQSVADAIAQIERVTKLENENEGINWAITVKGNNKLLGTICFWNFEKAHYRAETGYILHPDWQGKGIMQEAMVAILDHGFNIMKLHSVAAQVNPGNRASIKVLERNGFVREAYFRENYFYDGKFLDTGVYSLVESGYRAMLSNGVK